MSQFAQLQLEKYGWKEGKGLGREEKGITKAIKPKLKFDSAGFGHDIAREYKFHWWDHAFNKAAESITVEKVQDGSVQLTKKEVLAKEKKSAGGDAKAKFYGTFVKGGTLYREKEEKEVSESEESEDERDMSLTLTDEELFKICGKRTAHKGARHGLTMSAKLARVAEQERLLMEKWKSSEHLEQGSCKHEGIGKKKKLEDKKDVSKMYLKETDVKTPKKKKVKSLMNEVPLLSSKNSEEILDSCQGKILIKHNVTDSHLDCMENFVESTSEDLLMGLDQPIKNKKNKSVITVGINEYTRNCKEVVEKMNGKKRKKNKIDASEYTVTRPEEVKEKKAKQKKCFDDKGSNRAMMQKEKIKNGRDFYSESVREDSKKKCKYFETHQMEDEILHEPRSKKKKKK